jgi:metal-sulfur cluster biosynthetic enzyme
MPEPDLDLGLRAAILERLDEIKDPCSCAGGVPMGLGEMGLVDSVDISPAGDVAIRLRLTSPFCHMIGFMKKEAIAKVGALPAVRSVSLEADNGLDWSPSMISEAAQRRRQQRLDLVQMAASGGPPGAATA